jgi:CRP-like cAMP-binding protein
VDPERLAVFPLFSSLTPEQRAAVARWSEERAVAAGTTLATEGASGYVFYLIEEGEAEVREDGQVVNSLGRGDFFGECAILGEGRRTASVVSTSPMRLVVLHGQQFRQMEAAMPEVARRLNEAVAVRTQAPRVAPDEPT